MEELIKQIKEKADSIGTSTKIDRRVKGAYVDCLVMVKEALSIHDVSKSLPKGVNIVTAKSPQGFEFDQIDYDNWLESGIDDLDDFLEQELC